MITKNALRRMRQIMLAKSVGLYVLPRTDEHQSEYLSPSWERVAFLSGFTGSNAMALISQQEALLWTDGRYFLQATKQLSSEWQMKKMMAGEKKWFEHIADSYGSKTQIEIDSRLITASSAKQRQIFFKQKGFQFQLAERNLIDQIWFDRPKQERFSIFSHEEQAGKSISEKIHWIRNKIIEKKGEGAVFTDLGEIAWILNLRSSQIPFNPFFKSILLIGRQDGRLYLSEQNPSFSDKNLAQHLRKQKIQVWRDDPELNSKILCQANQINFSLYRKIKQPIEWQGIGLYRAVRTEKQIQGFRRSHFVDGLAMAQFWAWRSKLDSVNQYEAACYLDNLRKKQQGNMGLSFNTISGGGPNGAIIHYNATKSNSSTVTKNMIHLVDSGGQYIDGTTDVTRAFHFGNPTYEQKDAYTRVLLGNLDIQRMKWPKSVQLTGVELDVLARRHLWKKGLEYHHGTGHGVGYFGSVHEGPVGISRLNKTVLEQNMIVTNQPGYYQPGKFGIRIENMLRVKLSEGNMLGFENLTLCPYDKNLLNYQILTRDDIDHINTYHKRIYQILSPHLTHKNTVLQWLKLATSPIHTTKP